MFELDESNLFEVDRLSDNKYRFRECNDIIFIVELYQNTFKSFSFIEPVFFPKEFSNYEDRKKFGYLYGHNRPIKYRCPIRIISTVVKITLDYLRLNGCEVLMIYGHPTFRGEKLLKSPEEVRSNQRSSIYDYALDRNIRLAGNYQYIGREGTPIYAYCLPNVNQKEVVEFLMKKTEEELSDLIEEEE